VAQRIVREMFETAHFIVNLMLLSNHQVFNLILLWAVAATDTPGHALSFLFYSYDDDDDDNNNNLMCF
jgi:hypothetical protein